MNWIQLTDMSQLPHLIKTSKEQSTTGLTVLIFKHSTRCSISSMALNRLESKWKDSETTQPYFLDLLAHRDISNEIATLFNVEHASPQVLLIKDGKCFYHRSHTEISALDIAEVITTQTQ